MKRHLWLRNGALLSIPLVLGLVLLHIKLVRDRANVPLQNIVIPRAHRNANALEALAFSPDGQRIAIIDSDHHTQIWNINKSRFEQKLQQLYGTSLVWREDNRIVSGENHSFQVFDLANKKLEFEAPTDWKKRSYQFQKDHYSQCVFSPQGNLAALGQVHGAISVWDTRTGQQLCAFKAPNRETCGLAISVNEKMLAVASLLTEKDVQMGSRIYYKQIGIEIALRDARTGALKKSLRWDDAGIEKVMAYDGNLGNIGLAFSPDGTLLAGAATTGLSLWDVDRGQLIYVRKEESVPRYGGEKQIAFSSDGTLIAVIGWGKKIYVWDAKTGQLLQEFNGTYNRALTFSPDGKFLATGGQDNAGEAVVKIWNVSNMN